MNRQICQRFNQIKSFKNLPSIEELEQKTVLMMVNTDRAVDFPEPLQPNMIEIGGLQIAEPNPLSDEMENFIKTAKKGTILMSLGTNMKSNSLGDELLTKIIKTFAQLPDYNFIWKFESEAKDLPINLSKNVKIGKFLPQNDILANPGIVGFISHSGLLSTHEALYHGTPIIGSLLQFLDILLLKLSYQSSGMPFFLDQHRTISHTISLGVGSKVDFKTLTVENFKQSILSIVDNPKVAKNSARISKLFKDKPQKPLDKAVWWVDYVIRNPDLDNIKSPTLKLGFLATYSLDIIFAFVVISFVFLYAIRKLFMKIFCKKNSKRKTE